MASFTDSPQTFFSPAMPMVDLNLYGQTLDYKQGLYNQGVQRIQGSIDQVAGLDIMHPLAKEYLHNKLTDLGSRVNALAGGDFSNQSLVNQTMALAPQVAKDEKIQTALIATQQIRALSASQKRLYEKDPNMYPSSMRYMDNKAVSDYLNGTDLNEGYRGVTEASRYVDYNKDIEGLVKEIVPDVKMEINPDGRYQWRTEKYSTVTNDRIQSVIDGYLASHPESTRSLNADAMYTYREATPQFLYNHMSETYDRHIASLENINAQYAKEISEHPTNYDFIKDRSAAMVANRKSIEEMRSKKSLYAGYLHNEENLDMIKQTIYADNVKGMFSSIFQKDDIDRKIEENYNAKNADDFAIKRAGIANDVYKNQISEWQLRLKRIEMGIEPLLDKYGREVAITPSSQYYPMWQAQTKGKGGKGKNGEGADEHDLQTDPTSGHPVGNPKPGEEFTSAELHNQAAGLVNTITNQDGTGAKDRLFEVWKNSYGRIFTDPNSDYNKQKAFNQATFAPGSLNDPNNLKNLRDHFEDWMSSQYNDYLKGNNSATREWMEYHDKTMDVEMKLGMLTKMEKDATEFATNSVPLPDKKATIRIQSGRRLSDQTTSSEPTISYNMKDDPEFFNQYEEIYKQAHKNMQAQKSKDWNDGHRDFFNRDNERVAIEVNKLLNTSFKDSKYVNDFKQMNNSARTLTMGPDQVKGFAAYYHDVLDPVSDLRSERQRVKDAWLSKNGRDFAPNAYTFKGKPEVMDEVRRNISNYLSSNKNLGMSGTAYDKEVDLADIQPISAYEGPNGRTVYVFKVKGKPEDRVESTREGGDNDVIPIDPDRTLKNYLNMHHMTPVTGQGVLATSGGKIRYAISESAYRDGTYDIKVIDGGQPMQIPTISNNSIFHGASPSALKQAMEQYSMLPSNSDPRVPMSREEALYRLFHTVAEYEAAYPAPQKK